MSDDQEMLKMILSNLIFDSEYFIKVYHHLKKDYFPEGSAYKDIYTVIDSFYKKYDGKPTKIALSLELSNFGLTQERLVLAKDVLNSLTPYESEDKGVLIKMTEKYVRNVAFSNTIKESFEIYQNELLPDEFRDRRLPSLESTQDLFAKALSISFDNKLGHDYNTGWEERLESYMQGVEKIPFRLDSLNRMTNGGIERKTLNIPVAPTGVGKSMFLCSLASDYINMGYNVLYLTLEMGEMQVSKRIDANILDISLKQLNQDTINADLYRERAKKFMNMPNMGQLRVKEYASRSATVNDFRTLLEDYKIKEEFVPDIIFVDYLSIIKLATRDRLAKHEALDRLAVELRALAFDFDVAIWSPMQTNRDGVDKSDLSLSDIAGSYDVTTHADFIIMIIESEDGSETRTQRIKVVKNRYGSKDEDFFVDLFVSKGKQRYEDMGEYKTSPPNKPPLMAFSSPMEINDAGLVKQEPSKPKLEREIKFVEDETAEDIISQLDMVEGLWNNETN